MVEVVEMVEVSSLFFVVMLYFDSEIYQVKLTVIYDSNTSIHGRRCHPMVLIFLAIAVAYSGCNLLPRGT
jgi:hypothetical protein